MKVADLIEIIESKVSSDIKEINCSHSVMRGQWLDGHIAGLEFIQQFLVIINRGKGIKK